MIYDIKAIPTTYAGVNFRSRLEARWAAFFDLAGIRWEYEPLDLDGWAPDFLLRLDLCVVHVEVKPMDLTAIVEHINRTGDRSVDNHDYGKAIWHSRARQVALFGNSPFPYKGKFYMGDYCNPPDGATYSEDQVLEALHVAESVKFWREAGNKVQWRAGGV